MEGKNIKIDDFEEILFIFNFFFKEKFHSKYIFQTILVNGRKSIFEKKNFGKVLNIFKTTQESLVSKAINKRLKTFQPMVSTKSNVMNILLTNIGYLFTRRLTACKE